MKLVVFDLDGLLVDSEPYWNKSRGSIARENGKEWTDKDHRLVNGVNSNEWAQYMIERLELKMTREQVIQEVVDRIASYYIEDTPFLPGAIEAVQMCAKHWQVAIGSGSHLKLIDIVVNNPRIKGCFDLIVSADTVAKGKPSPEIYLEVMKQAGVDATDSICFEDSAFGIQAAYLAGMYVIAVPKKDFPVPDEYLAMADLVIGSLEEVSYELLSSLIKNG